jgi:hypothetical protein
VLFFFRADASTIFTLFILEEFELLTDQKREFISPKTALAGVVCGGRGCPHDPSSA